MKKTKFTALLLAGVMLSAFSLVSCDKEDDDDENVTPASNTELLTRAAWKGDFMVYDNDTTYDEFVSQMHFKPDGTVDIYDEDNTDFDTYNWLFTNEERQLVIDSDTSDIILLTDKNLTLGATDEGGDKLEFHLSR